MPIELIDERQPTLFVQVDDDLGVGMRSELVAARLEPRAKLDEVVDLAVIDDPDRPIFIGHRLIARSAEGR